MKITVAKSWKELSSWQLGEIAHLYMHADPDNFGETFRKLVFILFRCDDSIRGRIRLLRVLNRATLENLAPFANFLIETTNLYEFPKIAGLSAPAPRLASLTAEQFSTADRFFDEYINSKTEAPLRRLVATLYTFPEGFSKLRLQEVAAATKNLPVKFCEAIALLYQFCRIHIWNSYPVIFPKKNPEEEKLKPIFSKKNKYQSFDKVILGLVFSEEQPLGTKQQADQTPLYEFLNVFNESLIRMQAHAKRN